MLKSLFAPLAMKISGGIIAGLLVALALTLWRVDSLSEQRDEARAKVVSEQTRHIVTRSSLTLLTAKLKAYVQAGELRAERLDEALSEVEDETAALRAQADNFDIETVEGL